MQILHSDPKKGEVKVLIQELEDLWTLYNIIKPNDLVRARTFRRVVMRDGDAGERRPMVLQIQVEKCEFHEYSNRLRVLGQIKEGPDEFVSIGQYHTLNVEIGTKLLIQKDNWFKHEIQRLEKSTGTSTNKIVLVCAIESGLSTIGLISNYSLSIISTIRHNIPGKRYRDQTQNKNREEKEFYDSISKVLIENIKNQEISMVILCGPGFIKEHFSQHLKNIFTNEKIQIDIRLASASSATPSAINEIIRQGVIAEFISDHRLSNETQLLNDFVERLGKDQGLFTYGFDETLLAANLGAIQDLLITDLVMRTRINKDDRKKLEELFYLVENGRGKIHIISTLHPAGDQLQNYSGVASLLRFKTQ
ncbi:MAG: mRNA surveillance protein pelota [Promethearchaeota archaeon]|nr:MAG: mRNA surveillance protein pelota [Candidatus Lokiarchaeota archaeon]